MPFRIFSRVLTLAKWHVGNVVHDVGAVTLGVVAMCHDVSHADVDVLVSFPATWRAKLATASAQHDGPVADDELRVSHDAVSLGTQTFPKPERSTEALDGALDIFVHEYRNHCRGRCGLI